MVQFLMHSRSGVVQFVQVRSCAIFDAPIGEPEKCCIKNCYIVVLKQINAGFIACIHYFGSEFSGGGGGWFRVGTVSKKISK